MHSRHHTTTLERDRGRLATDNVQNFFCCPLLERTKRSWSQRSLQCPRWNVLAASDWSERTETLLFQFAQKALGYATLKKRTFWHLVDLCTFIKNLFWVFFGWHAGKHWRITPICQKLMSENLNERKTPDACACSFLCFWCSRCFMPEIDVSKLKWGRGTFCPQQWNITSILKPLLMEGALSHIETEPLLHFNMPHFRNIRWVIL